jgi:hypothetical protein
MKFALQINSGKVRGWLGLNGDNVSLFDSLAEANEAAGILSRCHGKQIKPVRVPQGIVEEILQDRENGINHGADAILVCKKDNISKDDIRKLQAD